MKASGWSNGQGTYGIRVGAANRRTFFDGDWNAVEVEIDDSVFTFGLTQGFWDDCPEIRDRGTPVIRNWLRRHHTLEWPKGYPPALELIPLGGNRFRLAS